MTPREKFALLQSKKKQHLAELREQGLSPKQGQILQEHGWSTEDLKSMPTCVIQNLLLQDRKSPTRTKKSPPTTRTTHKEKSPVDVYMEELDQVIRLSDRKEKYESLIEKMAQSNLYNLPQQPSKREQVEWIKKGSNPIHADRIDREYQKYQV